MKYTTLALSALVALGATQVQAQTNELSSIGIVTQVTAGGTANGVGVVTQ